MLSTVVGAVLGLIEQVLPLLGTSASTATLIGQIVTTIEKIMPLLTDFIPQFYQSVKNIIQALTADPATTQDQLVALQALDAQIDAAFEAAAKDVDPDAPVPTA